MVDRNISVRQEKMEGIAYSSSGLKSTVRLKEEEELQMVVHFHNRLKLVNHSLNQVFFQSQKRRMYFS